MNGDLNKAGIEFLDEHSRRLDFDALRHPANKRMSAIGVPLSFAQRQMRHSDLKPTANHYTDATLLPIAEALNAMSGFTDPPFSHVASHETGSEGRRLTIQKLRKNQRNPRKMRRLVPMWHLLSRLVQYKKMAPAVGFEPTVRVLRIRELLRLTHT